MNVSEVPSRKFDSEERKAILAQKIALNVSKGHRVESQSDYQAVLVQGRRPNHVLHLILTLVTLGVWVIVWILVAIFGGEDRAILAVDEYGNATVQKA